MDKKMLYAIGVVVILIVAAVGTYALIGGGNDTDDPSDLDSAELKVYGNINGDRFLDSNDANLIDKLIKDGSTATDYPLADANRDGILNSKDTDVIKNVVGGEQTTIWHINYHDVDSDGDMDSEVVSTKFPVKAAIQTASTNGATLMYCLGLTDHIVGASFGKTSLDTDLFSNSYFDTSKCEYLGSNSSEIAFEDGKVGSSDLIAKKKVTAVVTDWIKSYTTNEKDFENAGIDVIRVAAAATDRETLVHGCMLLGLLFQKAERADSYVTESMKILDMVTDTVDDLPKEKFIISNMNGYISNEESDYTKAVLVAGAEYGIPGTEFGNTTSIKIVDHPEVYMYDFDYIIHIRSNLNYIQSQDTIDNMWATYTAKFMDWEHADTGQYMLSGMIPIPLRVAYSAALLHSDAISQELVDNLHQAFIDKFFDDKSYDISKLDFIISVEDVNL